MPSALVNGIDLYHESHGDGPPVVFAHGVGGNHLSWWQQVPALRERYRCVIFDHRGFGRSPDAPGGPGQTAFVEDLRGLLDHLGIERASLVAQSMGGRTAFGFALAYPERVTALVMADTILGIPSRAIAKRRQELVREGKAMTGNAYHPGLKKTNTALAFLYEQIRGLNPPLPSTEERQRSALAEATPEDWDLSTFKIPTLFLFGKEDGQIPAELGQMAQKLIPGSRYAEVAGSGHSTYFEKPDDFNRIVLGFLREFGGA
jgi:3-oxoadipate enol-lactonase